MAFKKSLPVRGSSGYEGEYHVLTEIALNRTKDSILVKLLTYKDKATATSGGDPIDFMTFGFKFSEVPVEIVNGLRAPVYNFLAKEHPEIFGDAEKDL